MARARSSTSAAAAAWCLLLLLVLHTEVTVAEQLAGGFTPAGTVAYTLKFYSHNTLGGSNPTSKKVAPDTNQFGFGFGSFYVVDDNVTTTAARNSTSLGSLRGLVADSDKTGGLAYFSLHTTFHLTYPKQGIDGTIVIAGTSVGHPADGGWQFPIVGGTRDFEFVTGQADTLENTSFYDSPDGLSTKLWSIKLYVNLFDPLLPKLWALKSELSLAEY